MATRSLLMPSDTTVPAISIGGDRSLVAVSLLRASAASCVLLLLVIVFGNKYVGAGPTASMMVLVNALQPAAAVAFGVWLFRAYRNLQSITDKTAYSPRVAVSWFYLPGLNLLLPHIVLRELWVGSTPDSDRFDADLLPARSMFAACGWWYLFVIFAILNGLTTARFSGRTDLYGLGFACVLGAVAAYWGADMIRQVDRRQGLRHDLMYLLSSEGDAVEKATVIPASPSWASVVFPVVAGVDLEIQRSAAMKRAPAPSLVASATAIALPSPAAPASALALPDGTREPRAHILGVFFIALAIVSIIQMLVTVSDLSAALARPNAAASIGAAKLYRGLAGPQYALAVLCAWGLCRWIARIYSNVTFFRLTSMTSDDAVGRFITSLGGPDVIDEVWRAAHMWIRNAPNLRTWPWRVAWRTFVIMGPLAIVVSLLAPGRFSLFLMIIANALLTVSTILVRSVVKRVTNAQIKGLAGVAARRAESAAAPPEPIR
jgi:hypothetical protein